MTPARLFLQADGRLRPFWRAFLYAGLFLLLVVLFSLLAESLGVSRRVDPEGQLGLLVGAMAMVLAALAPAWLLLGWVDHGSFRSLGLWFFAGWGRELLWGVGLGVGLIALMAGLAAGLGQLDWERAAWDRTLALQGLIMLLVLAAAGTAEELMFRGYFFQRLVDSWGEFLAVFALSALFGGVHAHNPAATPLSTANTVLAGILLSLAYLRTRALWLPIGLHVAWNYTQGFFLGLPVSGLEFPGKLLLPQRSDTLWLSGGNYGLEGSVLATGVSVAACFWLVQTRRLGVSPAMARVLE